MISSMSLAVALTVGTVSLAASPAAALSCVDPDTVLAEATQVYTGTVDAVEGRTLRVSVIESWRGQVPSEKVTLVVDQIEWTAWGDLAGREVDADRVWVFAPYESSTSDHGMLSVGACTVWDAEHASVSAARPSEPKSPVAEPTPENARDGGSAVASAASDADPGEPVPSGAVWLAGGGVVVVVGLMIAIRRQRRLNALT